MANARATSLLLLLSLLPGCDDDGASGNGTTSEDGTTTDDEVMTTIPVTSVSATAPPSTDTSDTEDPSASETDPSGSTATTDTTGSDTEGSSSGDVTSSSSGGDGSTTTETTGGVEVWDIGWCNLQFPASIDGDTSTVTTAYARVYIEGLTDQSTFNDLHPSVQVDFGYGADDSDPAVDGWTWIPGQPNGGWNGSDAGRDNNDEYQGDLQFAAAGIYDYAARVSGDGGDTWVYCDLDGLVLDGYTSDQAGAATIE